MIPVQPGQVIDRYSVEEELGEGGMATVYLVRHTTLGTLHALKVLTVNSPGVRQRLIREGRIQGTLQHPNIVAVTDRVDVAGSPGLVMQFISGPALDDFLKTERLSFQQADAIARGIIEGVAAAHRHGLVHRDLKPGNVMLQIVGDRLIPKVTDFGLAKALEISGGRGQTHSGVAMGTPAYMAPEQIRDAATVDHRADVWSLGAILYELVSGERAFGTGEMFDIFMRIRSGDLIPIDERMPDLPAHRVRAITGALTADLDDRISSCEELLAIWTRGSASPTDVWDAAIVERAAESGRRAEMPSLSDQAETIHLGGNPPPTARNEIIGLTEPIAPPASMTQVDAEAPALGEPPSSSRRSALAVAVLALVAAGAAAWVMSAPRGTVVQDYRDATFERDGWVGVGLLPPGHPLKDYVEITTTAGHVERIREIQFPIENTQYKEIRQIWSDGDLGRIEYITGYGHPFRVQEVARAGHKLTLRNRDREGKPVLGPNHRTVEVVYAFDEGGRVSSIDFAGVTGEPMPNPDGVWTIVSERDALGREIRNTYRGPEGAAVATADGFVEKLWEYEDPANPYTFSAVVRRGWARAPLIGEDGCHRTERLHDEAARPSLFRCFDPRLKPVADLASGCRETSFAYSDEQSVIVCMSAGERVASRHGWATMSRSIAANGTYFMNRYRDLDGDLIADDGGVAGRGYTIDPRGALVGAGPYLDADGEATVDWRGAYGWRHDLDEFGHVRDQVFLDEAGQPMATLEGIALIRYAHDAAGNEAGYRTFDADEQPVLTDEGIHGVRHVFGPYGQELLSETFGLDGQLLVNQFGWASSKSEVDPRVGKPRTREVFDADGRPVLVRASGYHREERTWDAFGRLLELATWDTHGEPMAAADGHERIRYEYNQRGQRIAVNYLRSDGSPLEDPIQLARLEMAYDAYGNQSVNAGFDGTGAPTVIGRGCARFEFDFDLDLETERRCFSPSGRLLMAQRGEHDSLGRLLAVHYDPYQEGQPASVRYTWDSRGNRTSKTLLDGEGALFVGEAGWARWERTHDGRNREQSMHWFDDTGANVNVAACDCHGMESTYDARGRLAEARYTMADGGTRDGGNIEKMRYDQRNSLVEQALYDADGRPWASADGTSRVVIVRDANHQETRRIYYDIDDNELGDR